MTPDELEHQLLRIERRLKGLSEIVATAIAAGIAIVIGFALERLGGEAQRWSRLVTAVVFALTEWALLSRLKA
jgi:hypothetical protein